MRSLIILMMFSSILYGYEVDEILKKSEENYSKVTDYTCLYHKKELIKEKYYTDSNVIVKVRKSGSYYMKWTEGEDKGQEVIYSGEKYNNKMKAHPGGFFKFITVAIDPLGSTAMKKNRHPIFDLPIGYPLKIIKDNYELHKKLGAGSVAFSKEETLAGVETLQFTAILPENMGFYAHIIHINLDKNTMLPVKIEAYDWKKNLMEMYHFTEIRINPGLTDKDFDVKNKEYGF